jgi:hypothetical protein
MIFSLRAGGSEGQARVAGRTAGTPAGPRNVTAGADTPGRRKMYAPNPFQGGSSVSHFDVTATPNLLMEPSINGNLTQTVVPPVDLTFPLFQDIGWYARRTARERAPATAVAGAFFLVGGSGRRRKVAGRIAATRSAQRKRGGVAIAICRARKASTIAGLISPMAAS